MGSCKRTLDLAYHPENLTRAWRWVRTNPDASYKTYFRPLYGNYAVAPEALLEHLRDRLTRGVYEPAHACKLFFPKVSGILRPYSLLTVEDQIVYQALVNVVAEKLYPKMRSRYMVDVFGHLYAGKSSLWFYRRWQAGYAAFNRAARKAFAEGFGLTAHFDLTAFYDSLDHGVLKHFLRKLGCDEEFCDTLTGWLSHWTATRHRIYHNHGIPQGPLGSGLLAEAVLRHFDVNHGAPDSVRYFRYVDDIRLYAKSERTLRKMITKLDLLSKDVGLFPQTSKIEIHEVKDIEAELKTVSRPEEDIYDKDAHEFDQTVVRRRLKELSPRGRVTDATEFKYLLGVARPTAHLNQRVWQVLEKQPELYANILRYFQKYPTLPRKVADRLLAELQAKPLYAAIIADLIRTATDRLPSAHLARLDAYVKTEWKPASYHAADHLAALGCWGIRRRVLTASQVEHAVRNLEEWWARSELVSVLDKDAYGKPTLQALLNAKLEDKVSDVAIAAAVLLAREGLQVTLPGQLINPLAARVLEAFNVLPGGASRVCGIDRSFRRILGSQPPAVEWRAFFGRHYPLVEKHMVWCSGLADTDVTAWVNGMDVFDDWLLRSLFQRDRTLGQYQFGNVGGILNCAALQTAYPAVFAMVNDLHANRGRSPLSHAYLKKGKRLIRPTARIKFRYLKTARKLIASALAELAGKTW